MIHLISISLLWPVSHIQLKLYICCQGGHVLSFRNTLTYKVPLSNPSSCKGHRKLIFVPVQFSISHSPQYHPAICSLPTALSQLTLWRQWISTSWDSACLAFLSVLPPAFPREVQEQLLLPAWVTCSPGYLASAQAGWKWQFLPRETQSSWWLRVAGSASEVLRNNEIFVEVRPKYVKRPTISRLSESPKFLCSVAGTGPFTQRVFAGVFRWCSRATLLKKPQKSTDLHITDSPLFTHEQQKTKANFLALGTIWDQSWSTGWKKKKKESCLGASLGLAPGTWKRAEPEITNH